MKWYDGLKVFVYIGNDLSRCLFVNGCYEPNEFVLLSKTLHRGMVFIDAGANDGLYSLFASKRVGTQGKVLAIEPSSREFKRLVSNLRLNRLKNVHPLRVALSNMDGAATLRVAGFEHEGQNTLGDFAYEGVTCLGKEHVETIQLDKLIGRHGLDRVDYIKLDVEGAEHKVLLGARRILTTYCPHLILEVNDNSLRWQGSWASELLGLLKDLGYETYTFDNRTGKPLKVTEGSILSSNIAATHTTRQWTGFP